MCQSSKASTGTLSTFAIFNMIIPFLISPVPGAGQTDWSELLNNATFKSLTPYEFCCAEYEGLEILEWEDLTIESIANKARAGGVSGGNINAIKSILRYGYVVTERPPIVVIMPDGSKELWDGYNRYSCSDDLNIPDFPFLVYRLKEEWADRIEDAYDIVSLGANLHASSQRHTPQDFITRGVQYCKRQQAEGNGTKTQDEIKTWVNSINHSFNDKEVERIVKQIYHNTTIAVNINPYSHPKVARAAVDSIIDDQTSRNPVVICCKENEYVERGFLQIMKNATGADHTLECNTVDTIPTTDVVIYTKGCETAQEVSEQREYAIDLLKKLDKLVLKYAAARMEQMQDGKNTYEIMGALPQLIGVEDLETLVNL